MEISAYCAYIDGKNIWLPSEDLNALFCQKLDREEPFEYLCSFKVNRNWNAWKIGNILRFENNLFFFSRCAYEVWILNIDTQIIEKVSYYSDGSCFIPDIVQVGNEAWVMARSFASPVIVFNLSTRQSEEVAWGEKNGASDKNAFIYGCEKDGCIYFATRVPGNIHLCIVDCQSRKIKCRKLDGVDCINCLTVHDEILYALVLDKNRKAQLKKYTVRDMSEECSIELKKTDASWNDAMMFYSRMFWFRNCIIILPSCAKNIVIYDMNMEEESSISLTDICFNECKKRTESYFGQSAIVAETVYLCSFHKYLLKINLNNMEVRLKKLLFVEKDFWETYIKNQTGVNVVMVESDTFPIKKYFNHMINAADFSDQDRECECGKCIYDSVCEMK